MTTSRIEVRTTADPRLLSSVRALARAWLKEFECPEARAPEVILAIDEACANSIRHACQGDATKQVQLDFVAKGKTLEIVLTDQGVPLTTDVVESRREFPQHDPHNLTPGGLGLPIMHRVFDEVRFERGEQGGNRITMRLKLGAGAAVRRPGPVEEK